MSKPPAILSSLYHRAAQHIKVAISNDEESKHRIRQVGGRKWSRTHRCWYVPYSAEAYRQLQELFDVEVPPAFSKPVQNGPSASPAQEMPDNRADTAVIRLEKESDKHMKAFVPWQQKDWIEKIKTIPGRAWNQEEKYWSLPMVQSVLMQLREWFGEQAMFSFDLPANLPADYRPANWQQPQPGDRTPPPSVKPAKKQEGYAGMAASGVANANHLPGSNAFFGDNRVTDKTNPQKIASTGKSSPVAPTGEDIFNPARPPHPAPEKIAARPKVDNPSAFPFPAEKRRMYPSAGSVKPLFFSVQKDGKPTKAVGGKLAIAEPWDEHWCCIYIPGDRQDWVNLVKNVPGRRWHPDEKAWLLPMTQETARDISEMFGADLRSSVSFTGQIPERFIDKAAKAWKHKEPAYQLDEIQQLALTALEEKLMLEGKAHRTIKTYKNQLAGLLAYYPGSKPSSLSIKQIQGYMLYKRRESKLSNSAMNSLISALNAFYGRLLNQLDKVQALERMPRQRTLPNVLSTQEIQELLKATDNIKHKCMLILIYSAGLRKGELLRLRCRDLNPTRQCLFVKNGKGGKDRYTFYPPLAIKYVNAYLKEYKPRYWLFEGLTGDQYSESGLQDIFEEARLKSGVNPHITIHGLRHSFATHLVERNVPLHVVKQLLGHENIKTTEVYLHISNKYMSEIKSPAEGLDI